MPSDSSNGPNGANGTNGSRQPPVDISVATNPNDIDSVPRIIKELVAGVGNLSEGGDAARHDLLLRARSLVQALETPRETMIKHCWAQVRSPLGLLCFLRQGQVKTDNS